MAYELAIDPRTLDAGQTALLALLRRLKDLDYRFVTVTSSTHGHIAGRRETGGDLRDLLGWSLPVDPDAVEPPVLGLLDRAGVLRREGRLVCSTVRVSSVGDDLFLHSAWPTKSPDSVFLGPDTYRFVRFLKTAFPDSLPRRIVDIGAGAGVGAVSAARLAPEARLQMTEINPAAVRLAAVNAAAAGVAADIVEAPGLEGVARGFDLAVANPPFMAGGSRVYSSGGGATGEKLSLEWAEAALDRLSPGGRLILYTASAIAEGGEDRLQAALRRIAAHRQAGLAYEEIDPDIFGRALREPEYRGVERIAAVGAVLSRPA